MEEDAWRPVLILKQTQRVVNRTFTPGGQARDDLSAGLYIHDAQAAGQHPELFTSCPPTGFHFIHFSSKTKPTVSSASTA